MSHGTLEGGATQGPALGDLSRAGSSRLPLTTTHCSSPRGLAQRRRLARGLSAHRSTHLSQLLLSHHVHDGPAPPPQAPRVILHGRKSRSKTSEVATTSRPTTKPTSVNKKPNLTPNSNHSCTIGVRWTSAARTSKLSFAELAIAESVQILHGAITIAEVRKVPLAIAVAKLRSSYMTCASSATPSGS